MSTLPFLRRRRPRARHIHRGARRRLLVWLAAVPVLVLVALVASAVIDNALHRGRVLRNVSVAGADISGTRDAPLRARLEALVPDVAALPVELRSGDQVVNTTASAAGLRMDVEATAAAARHTGRGGITSPFSWIAGFFSDRTAPLRLAVDEPTLAGALAPFGSAGQDQLRFEVRDGKIVATVGQPGMRVDAAAAADALRRSAARGDKPLRAAVRATRAEPKYSTEQLAAISDDANRATAGGLTVTVAGRTKTVDERTVRGWLRADDATSSYAVNATTAKAALAALFPDVGGPGSDATVAIVFGNPVITGGDPATSCCADDTGDRVLAALKAGKHDVELALAATPHARGKEWAQGLGIREVVGQFTTRYPAGQPRVKNIKRIAELMQNVVIEPGQTFSINEFIGKRTTDKGFVSAGVIQNGVFQEDVGGGISQFATTTFNAAFFAGLDFAEYQSHSIYINRYPYGREATLSYPSPDLKIVNSTPYGILVATNATDTSITVQLWSTKFAHGEQTAQSERQVGKSCTRVTTERTRTYVDGRPNKVDTVTAVYRPEGVDCNGNPSAPSVTAVPPTTAPPPPGPTPTTTPPPTTAPAPGPSPTTVPPATSTPPAGPPPTTAAPAGLVGASRR